MSLLRSILNGSGAGPGRGYAAAYSRNRDHELELPLYHREPAPGIPGPVTKSIYYGGGGGAVPSEEDDAEVFASQLHASTLRLEQASVQSQDLLHLRRREQYLQERLQELLDAQADGLLAGLSGGTGGPGGTASGSTTPTAWSLRTESGRGSSTGGGWASTARERSRQRQQERQRRPGLRAARRQIYQTVRQLSQVKSEEDAQLEQEQRGDEQVLEQIDAWERKRALLERGTREAEEGDEDGRESRARLQAEADGLHGQIEELDVRLAQMKSRHRQLLAEIEDIDGAVQSRLASYRSSANMLERDIRRFLDTPDGIGDASVAARTSPFLMLPPKRRTLSLAKDHWQDRLNDVERARKEGTMEREALDEGAVLWKEVVTTITDFESQLKEQMPSLARRKSGADENDADISNSNYDNGGDADSPAEQLLRRMDEVVSEVEAHHEHAREKEWKLLVCCVGAELEALKQGRQILRDLFLPGHASAEPDDTDGGRTSTASSAASRRTGSEDSSAGKNSTSGPRRGGRRASPLVRVPAPSESDDDDPDPELLVTRQ